MLKIGVNVVTYVTVVGGSLRKGKAPLQKYTLGAPNKMIIDIDFIGPFMKTNRGNKHLLVVQQMDRML